MNVEYLRERERERERQDGRARKEKELVFLTSFWEDGEDKAGEAVFQEVVKWAARQGEGR